jgi:hypothetical protein
MKLRRLRLQLPPTLLLIAGFASGCVEAPQPQLRVPQPAEAGWEEQVQQVRSGQSSAIVFASQPVSPDQWHMLQEQCRSLQRLDVDGRLLLGDDLQLLIDLPELQRLKLTGVVDDAAMAQIATLDGLKVLNLPEGVFSDAGLQQLEGLKQLELLRFSSPNVTDAGLTVVPKLKSLRFLHLINVPLTDAGLQQLHGLKNLESFYLDGGRCTDEGLYALLRALPRLHFHRDQLHLPDDPHTHPHDDAAGVR